MKRYIVAILYVSLAFQARSAAAADIVPGTSDALPQLVTPRGTYKLGKKPYPAGTRSQWIAEGRVLARAPEGYYLPRKTLKSAADNHGYLPPIGDQGSEGSCVHWAGSYYAKTANMKRTDPSLDITVSSNQCSPRFTYNLTNGGLDNGGYGHEPFEVFLRYGGASLMQKPYTAGDFTALPVVADFIEGLHRRTANYVWLWDWTPDAAQIAELKTFLDAGGAAVCAIDADASFQAWTSGAVPWVGPLCKASDLNHMVTVCGYGPGYYLVANSWGPDWGSNGYFQVDSSYFETYVGDVMYPLEGSYAPATSYATLLIQHGQRSDIQSLEFSVNGTTVWAHSPLPKNLPSGTGSFDTDTRDGWQLAVDLSSAAWGAVNAVTGRCMDSVSGTAGAVTEFALRFNASDHVSTNTPVAIPDNTGVPAAVWLTTLSVTSAPTVLGDDAAHVTADSATLQGRVIPNGLATCWRFQYGTNASVSQSTAWISAGDGAALTHCSADLLGLKPETLYYCRLSATNSSGTASAATRTFTTPPGSSVQTSLLREGFEHGGAPPSGWTETGGAYWQYLTKGYGHPAKPSGAYDGDYMAVFFVNRYAVTNRLMTPVLYFAGHTNSPTLSFWHYMESWLGDQDVLNVKYKTSAGADPVLLATYSSSVSTWTQRTLALPNVNNTYSLIFEAVGNYGYGVCLDDVEIRGTSSFPVTIEAPPGATVPAAGEHAFAAGTVLTNWALSPCTQGATQYVCSGWAAAEGLAPAGGLGTQAVVTVNGPGTLTWLWSTHFRLTTSADAHGSVLPATGWQPSGSLVQITATADPYYHFGHWTGDASGAVNPLDLLMASPCSVTATFEENLATHSTPEWWLAEYGWTNDFDAAALADTDGDGYASYQEYVAGSNPTNRGSVFRAQIEMNGGLPRVTWSPDLGAARLYEVEGKTNLTDGAWGPADAASRFFRVNVSMP